MESSGCRAGAGRVELPVGEVWSVAVSVKGGRLLISFLLACCINTLMALQSQRMIILSANILSFQKGLRGDRLLAT